MDHRTILAAIAALIAAAPPTSLTAQVPPQTDTRIFDIVASSSAERVEADIRRLAGFGTRNTFSDTLSATRGIGAARRWIKAEFDRISEACGGCYEVVYQRSLVTSEDSPRIPQDTWVVNVLAVKRGTLNPDHYVIMSGDIDSRASSGSDGVSDAPGANDNASGMAAAIEAARCGPPPPWNGRRSRTRGSWVTRSTGATRRLPGGSIRSGSET